MMTFAGGTARRLCRYFHVQMVVECRNELLQNAEYRMQK